MPTESSAEVRVHVHGVAIGGDGVGRDESGRVVFVAGALPGEQVSARIRTEHARFAHADVDQVHEPSPHRIAPPCPHLLAGCGGCGFGHVDVAEQRRLKVAMITEALERIGHVEAPVVLAGPDLEPAGFRTTVRVALVSGRAGFRAAHGHQRIPVDSCRVSHPLVEDVLRSGRFGDNDEAVLRVGARTGERLAVVSPSTAGVELPPDVLVVGSGELRGGRRARFHEIVGGVRLRISAESFFQSRPDGAEAMVDLVAEALVGVAPDAPMVDLYCGVGLFAAIVGPGRPVVAVERARSSVADARHNLRELDAKVVRSSVERWTPSAAAAVVADPPRRGLGREGVAKVGATGAARLALVSCDAGSLGRDAGLLAAAGWRHVQSTLVDLFTDTPHVEVVSRFDR